MATSLSLHPSWMSDTYDDKVGMLHRFKVSVGDYKLGGWQKVTGMSVDFKPTAIAQACFNTYTVQLLSQPTWAPIVLERAILWDSSEWELTYKFLADAMANPQPGRNGRSAVPPKTLTIQINSAWGEKVRTLRFVNARPSKWDGPSLSAASTQAVATEKLTFVHEGFFPDGSLEGGGDL
jgi:phage tail-like protein